MILRDYHVHTTFCDGKNSPEEMVAAAIEKGMSAIGFSGHSFTAFDPSWCMSEQGTADYFREISRLKIKYRGKIEILCGIEQDYYSQADTSCCDYVIGSVHYLFTDGEYVPVDESAELLLSAAKNHFQGDLFALIERYFNTVSDVAEKTRCNVIGHFDLITKFNEGGKLFDESDARYVSAWKNAADTLLNSGAIFEINTGAMSRGYRSQPYPSAAIREYIAEKGGRFLLSGDAHSTTGLCYDFSDFKDSGLSILEHP